MPTPSVSYLAYTSGARLARVLPEAAGRPLASGVGHVAAAALRPRRAQVERNLVRILGPMSARERRRRTNATFRNYARFWYEFLSLTGEDPRRLLDRVDVEGWEHLEAALALGNGVIGAVPHLGGYDILGAWMALRGVPLTVVVEAVEPPELFEWFLRARTRLGLDVVPLDPEAGVAIAQALADGNVVALMSDRDLTGDGVDVEFFGEVTTFPAGPAVLAFRSGAPIIPAVAFFEDGDRFRLVLEEPIPTQREGRLREDVAHVTAAIARRFEAMISSAPEQWFVLQPTWPSDWAASGGDQR